MTFITFFNLTNTTTKCSGVEKCVVIRNGKTYVELQFNLKALLANDKFFSSMKLVKKQRKILHLFS